VTKESRRTVLKRGSGNSFDKILPDLCLLNFGVVDVDECSLRQEVADQGDGSGFTSVTRIGLEGKSENSDTL